MVLLNSTSTEGISMKTNSLERRNSNSVETLRARSIANYKMDLGIKVISENKTRESGNSGRGRGSGNVLDDNTCDLENGREATAPLNVESSGVGNSWRTVAMNESENEQTSFHVPDTFKAFRRSSIRNLADREVLLKRSTSLFRRTKIQVQPPKKTWDDKQFYENDAMTRSPSKMVSLNQWPLKKWAKYSIWTGWALFLMFVLGYGDWAYPDGSNPTCPTHGSQMIGRNKATCEMVESLSGASPGLIFLSSFILGGFLSSTRSLWLARKSSYCALCGATRNLLINVTTLPPSENRNLLARWALLGYELSVLKARSIVDTQEGKEYLEKSRLVIEDEWESMVAGDRHTTAWYWIQTKAKELHDSGRINAFELQTLCNAVTLSRDRANDLMSCIDRDQPPPYVFVCAVIININLVFHSTAAGAEWSVWMHDAGVFAVFTQPRLYCGIVASYFFTTIFALLFDVCALLYNPLGGRDFDINVSTR